MEKNKISPEMIAYYQEQKDSLKKLVDSGVYNEKNFDDRTSLYTQLFDNGEEMGMQIILSNGLVIRSGDVVKMKRVDPEKITETTSETYIRIGEFRPNFNNNAIAISHFPNPSAYPDLDLKLTDIAENVSAVSRQHALRQKRLTTAREILVK
jgi:hypothetical protein